MITPRKTRNVARAIVRKWKSIVDVPVEQYLAYQKINRLREKAWAVNFPRSDRAHRFPKELKQRQLEEQSAQIKAEIATKTT